MKDVKEKMSEIIKKQPDDATDEDIMRELAFERMIERGLENSRNNKVISDEEMKKNLYKITH